MNKENSSHYHMSDFVKLCDYLGEDIDSAVCSELLDHIDACQECKLYFESVKDMVSLYRENEVAESVPEDCRKQIISLITEKKKQT